MNDDVPRAPRRWRTPTRSRSRSWKWRKIAEDFAKAEGYDLKKGIWLTIKAMITAASNGDSGAARALWDRMYGAVEKGPDLEVSFNTALMAGPAMPEGPALADWTKRLYLLTQEEHGNGNGSSGTGS